MRTRFSPPETIEHNVENVRGLMLAAVLKNESIRLLLGCSHEEAERFGGEARGRMAELKRRVERAKS